MSIPNSQKAVCLLSKEEHVFHITSRNAKFTKEQRELQERLIRDAKKNLKLTARGVWS